MAKSSGRGWLLHYLALCAIWGSSFFLTHQAIAAVTPLGMAFWRCALGALTLLPIMLATKTKFGMTFKNILTIATGGLFMNAIPWMLYGFAQQHVTSVLASIINGATPIMTLLALLTIFRSEKTKPNVIIGLLIGAVGLFIALAAWQGFGENDPASVVALIGAIACYGIGGPYIKRFVTPLGLPLTSSVVVQLGSAALIVLPFYLTSGPLFSAPLTPAVIWSTLALGALGSGLSYVLYYRIIAEAGSAIANSVTYVLPLVAILLGVIALGEPLLWHEPVGAVIVILGAAISQGYLTKKTKVN